jgi:RNA polymerase sigma-70 factor (ECF subfamily)
MAGHWCSPPSRWTEDPEDSVATKEAVDVVRAAITALPPTQREVVTLRDVECWTAQEVCNAMGLSETNQRVLLHRGRSTVRRHLEEHYEDS